MRKLNQTGAVDLLLIVALLAVLAVGGFVIYRVQNQEVAKSSNTTSQQNATNSAQNAEPETYTPREGITPYTVEQLGVTFDVPSDWIKKSYGENSESNEKRIFEAWTVGSVEVRLNASAVTECPQGDGAPFSHFQGYYEEAGKNFYNWCPQEESVTKREVTETKSLDSVNLGKVFYDSGSGDCDLFFCSEEDVAQKTKHHAFVSVFNIEYNAYTGGSFYLGHVGDDEAVSEINSAVIEVLKSLRKAE